LQKTHHQGFTLIEMSIVLVIIGLIVGGVLVGQDLIRAAGVRATISQIEKFNTAANTFFEKYRYLPGDIPAGPAAQFGFAARGQYAGEGDGNGLIEGVTSNAASSNLGYAFGAGETTMFWSDLTYANGQNLNLIEGSFSAASPSTIATFPVANVSSYFPAAKLGNGNYFYVYSNRVDSAAVMLAQPITNFYGIAIIKNINNSNGLNSAQGLSIQQAYDIDKKIDDGLANSGRVVGASVVGAISDIPNNNPYLSTACYSTFSGVYYVAQNPNAVICSLSFRMQAGD
jgi:prepilin-type N-terminal cleavage/methylation domain-containing protein